MTKPIVSIARAIGPLLLVGVLISGCSGESGPSKVGEPDIRQLIDVSDLTDYSYPLDPYRYLPWQENVTDQARDALVARCLKRFGLDAVTPSRPVTKQHRIVERRYSLVPAADAASHGWHLPASGKTPAEPEKDVLSPEVRAVITGQGQSSYNGLAVPEGGCAGEANRVLGARVDRTRLADQLDYRALEMTYRDSRVAAATQEWSSCMRAAGFDYSSPRNAIADPMLQGEAPSELEIKVATASVECATKANLLAISLTADVAYQRRLVEENASALDAIKDARDAERRRAAEILAGE